MNTHMTQQQKIQWFIDRHRATNHMYEEGVNYEVHLKIVVAMIHKFRHLIPAEAFNDVELGGWGHDSIEDARVSYNDIRKVMGVTVAEICFACTNDKGKNRSERAGEKYYKGIRDTPYAAFVKLCDRLANVLYSIMTGNTEKTDMYHNENAKFVKALGLEEFKFHMYQEMFDYLANLFK